MDNAGSRPDHRDIFNAYRLILGREPESAQVVDETLAHADAAWLTRFFGSDEFRHNVLEKVRSGGALVAPTFAVNLDPELINWGARTLPLTEPARASLRRATRWDQVFHVLFADEIFVSEVLEKAIGPLDEGLLRAVDLWSDRAFLHDIEGAVELVSDSEIRGWAINASDVDRPLVVELWIGNRFIASGMTSFFRREVQERFGGRGQCGFSINYGPAAAEISGRRGEVREASSARRLGEVALPIQGIRHLDAVAVIRGQLEEIRATLARIEAHLPAFHNAMGFDLASYDAYFRAYYSPLERAQPETIETRDVAVIIDATGLPASSIDRTLSSIGRQWFRPQQLIVVDDSAERMPELEAVKQRFAPIWSEQLDITLICSDLGWTQAMSRALEVAETEHLLLVRGDCAISPLRSACWMIACAAERCSPSPTKMS